MTLRPCSLSHPAISIDLDPDMTMTDIARLLTRVGASYPTERCRELADSLAAELGEAYLDRMVRDLITAPSRHV